MSLAVFPSLDIPSVDYRVAFVGAITAKVSASICKEFVERGLIVIGCARNKELLESLAKSEREKGSPGELHVIECDLTKESEIIAMFKKIRSSFLRIDICVNVSDFFPFCSFEMSEEAGLRNILEEHVMALSRCTRETVKLMQEKNIKGGTIIQVFPIGNVIHRHPDTPPMPTSDYYIHMGIKYTLLAFTESIRRKIQLIDGRMACIYPGPEVIDLVLGRMTPLEAHQKFFNAKRSEAEVIVGHVMKILEAEYKKTVNDIVLLPKDFS